MLCPSSIRRKVSGGRGEPIHEVLHGPAPLHVETNISLTEIEREIYASQKPRVDAMTHIQALNAVIEVALV